MNSRLGVALENPFTCPTEVNPPKEIDRLISSLVYPLTPPIVGEKSREYE